VGGDDYVTKPFSLAVLLAKAKAVLKHSAPISAPAMVQAPIEIIRFGRIKIELGNERVTRNGELVKLKPMELKLLLYLIENNGKRVTKDELLEKVWGDTVIGEGTLNVHICHLREKLEDVPNEPCFIKTVCGSGYMIEKIE
jgi:two-component system response regulator RegX3